MSISWKTIQPTFAIVVFSMYSDKVFVKILWQCLMWCTISIPNRLHSHRDANTTMPTPADRLVSFICLIHH